MINSKFSIIVTSRKEKTDPRSGKRDVKCFCKFYKDDGYILQCQDIIELS